MHLKSPTATAATKTVYMRRKFTAIITIAAFILAATSCKKDDTLRYNNVTMGNVVNGTFVSDQGNMFNVVENNSGKEIENEKRAIISCDVLRQVAGTENEYEVRLNSFQSVFTKSPIKAGEITDDEKKVEDPISINDIWYAGGYLNLQILVFIKENSETVHQLNLVINETDTAKDGYSFTLRHNAYGDLPDDENTDFQDYVIAGTFVSFPISDIIKEDEAKITINWKWYESAGMGITKDLKDYTFTSNWRRNIFEQTPIPTAAKTIKAVR